MTKQLKLTMKKSPETSAHCLLRANEMISQSNMPGAQIQMGLSSGSQFQPVCVEVIRQIIFIA